MKRQALLAYILQGLQPVGAPKDESPAIAESTKNFPGGWIKSKDYKRQFSRCKGLKRVRSLAGGVLTHIKADVQHLTYSNPGENPEASGVGAEQIGNIFVGDINSLGRASRAFDTMLVLSLIHI